MLSKKYEKAAIEMSSRKPSAIVMKMKAESWPAESEEMKEEKLKWNEASMQWRRKLKHQSEEISKAKALCIKYHQKEEILPALMA